MRSAIQRIFKGSDLQHMTKPHSFLGPPSCIFDHYKLSRTQPLWSSTGITFFCAHIQDNLQSTSAAEYSHTYVSIHRGCSQIEIEMCTHRRRKNEGGDDNNERKTFQKMDQNADEYKHINHLKIHIRSIHTYMQERSGHG